MFIKNMFSLFSLYYEHPPVWILSQYMLVHLRLSFRIPMVACSCLHFRSIEKNLFTYWTKIKLTDIRCLNISTAFNKIIIS